MKVDILDVLKNKVGEIKLPEQFSEEYRPDLIARAVLAIQSNKRQPYGASPNAGQRHSAKLSRRRRKYKTAYGHGISRVPRKIMSRSGARFNWVGAVAPGTVGGRQAHPPKPVKLWSKKINDKERLKAIRSAISATMIKGIVEARNHILPDNFPFIIDDGFSSIQKTKNVFQALKALGFEKELERGKIKKVRHGKGKMRGRKYSKRKSVLIVATRDSKILKSARNIPGIDAVDIKNLNAELLAPGTKPGRLTLWTKSAIGQLEKEKLFLAK